MIERKIFRNLVSVEEAIKVVESIMKNLDRKVENVNILDVYGRVLAEDIFSPIDLPPFDRSAMDGYAVIAEDTFKADEENPAILELSGVVEIGKKPEIEVEKGKAVKISTGAMIPANANAVVMVEYTSEHDGFVEIYKPVSPGENVIHAGSDVMAGELVARKGYIVTARESGIIAAIGLKEINVYKKPVVGIISTGNEITLWGEKLEAGKIYDVNSAMLHSAIIENGGIPKLMGVVKDDAVLLENKIIESIKSCDILLLSGGTSAGEGDLVYRILSKLGNVLVHGIAVKPGKPTVFALIDKKPVFGLPGYPTSAFMIFEKFVSPIIRYLSGLSISRKYNTIKASLALKVYSAHGKREFLPVSIITSENSVSAYPVGGNYSAYISKLVEADGFIEIPESVAFLDQQEVDVHLFSTLKPSDLVIIGSHCIGLDILIRISKIKAKIINAGSTGGLLAIKKGEADIAGTHLLDEDSGEYNIPIMKRLKLDAVLVKGYLREQGFIVSKGNPKNIEWFDDLLRDDVRFINRNTGSGTRVLLDMNLKKLAEKLGVGFSELVKRIDGYNVEAKTHNAVAVAVLMGKADVGLGIKSVADFYGLDFIPVRAEEYDFAIKKDRLNKESVKMFLNTLESEDFARELKKIGMGIWDKTGEIIEL